MSEPVSIISDIHGNLQALQAVIEDIESQGSRERICLGDIVGYGGQPAECLELIRVKGFKTVQGNHDAYAASDDDPDGTSDDTKAVIRWTRGVLSDEQRGWLGALPLTLKADDYEAVHASLHHPEEWGYVLEPSAAAQHFSHQQTDVCFIGHSHQPKMFVEGEDKKIDNRADISGFRHEADAFFARLKKNKIDNLKLICGDRHWQYHSIHPSGIEEFACGALNDENSRMGVAPGAKTGSDPDALTKQPYTSVTPQGGFL